MEKSKESKKEIAKEINRVISEMENTEQVERIIMDNKIIFKVGETKYRVRIPTPGEQLEIENYRRKKYTEYVDDGNMGQIRVMHFKVV